MPTYESVRLINTILTLYYVEELTQAEIAQRLGLSTAKVNRLLQQAREQGYVNITIRTPFQQLFDLEARLKAVFGLQEAIVIPAVGDSSRSLLNALGTVAAEFSAGAPARRRCVGHHSRHNRSGRRPGD